MRIYYCDVCDEEITETELIVQLIVANGNIEKYVPLEDIKYVEPVNDGNESLRRWRKIT